MLNRLGTGTSLTPTTRLREDTGGTGGNADSDLYCVEHLGRDSDDAYLVRIVNVATAATLPRGKNASKRAPKIIAFGLSLEAAKQFCDGLDKVVGSRVRVVDGAEVPKAAENARSKSAPAAPSDDADFYSVEALKSVEGFAKIFAIKVLRDTTGASIDEAKCAIENAPGVVARRLSRGAAMTICARLNGVGLKARVAKD